MQFPHVCQQDVGQGARKRPHPQEMTLSNFPGTPEGLSEAVQWVQARFKELEVCWAYLGEVLCQCECSSIRWSALWLHRLAHVWSCDVVPRRTHG